MSISSLKFLKSKSVLVKAIKLIISTVYQIFSRVLFGCFVFYPWGTFFLLLKLGVASDLLWRGGVGRRAEGRPEWAELQCPINIWQSRWELPLPCSLFHPRFLEEDDEQDNPASLQGTWDRDNTGTVFVC